MKTTLIGLASLGLLTAACTAQDDGGDIDQALLAEYRAALPSRATLEAAAPMPTTSAALGDPAMLPHSSWELVLGINGTVGATLDLLEAVVMQPPTFYDSATREFVWGPWPDDVGYVAAYVRDTEGNADFRYEFAFLRGASNDLATLTPIVWGGATPDPNDDDHGIGVTMWDFTANRAFEEANAPTFDPDAHDRGRFVALYAAGPDENDPANEATWVVAVFRDFVSKDEPDQAPVDLDYLYGRYQTPAHVVDFLDYEAPIDVSEPADGVREDLGVRMAFLDEGTGRAEADAINGSLEANHRVEVVECWDTSLSQTFVQFQKLEGGNVVDSASEGAAADCGMFDATLDSLDVPSLANIDPALLAILDEVATTGAPPAE